MYSSSQIKLMLDIHLLLLTMEDMMLIYDVKCWLNKPAWILITPENVENCIDFNIKITV